MILLNCTCVICNEGEEYRCEGCTVQCISSNINKTMCFITFLCGIKLCMCDGAYKNETEHVLVSEKELTSTYSLPVAGGVYVAM
jgi:hypothetical protein